MVWYLLAKVVERDADEFYLINKNYKLNFFRVNKEARIYLKENLKLLCADDPIDDAK